jgi:Sigma-70, region 4
LAFVTALQHLPPRQRCVLVLRDVLGFRAPEGAAMLDSTEASVNSALQPARSTLRARVDAAPSEDASLPPSRRGREVVGRFAAAAEAGDVEGMVALHTDDSWPTMPPGRTSTRAASPSPGSSTIGGAGAAPTSSSCPRGQRTARVRLLPARCARGDRPRVRPDGPYLAPRPDLGDHLVWRPCRDGPVRPAARAPRLGRHRIAIGLTGEPVPPTIRSGAATNRNSHRSAASQSGTRSSNCR